MRTHNTIIFPNLNPGMVRAWDKTHFFFRSNYYPSFISGGYITEYMTIRDIRAINLNVDLGSLEDPRVIFNNDEIICLYSASKILCPNCEKDKPYTELGYAFKCDVIMAKIGPEFAVKSNEVCTYIDRNFVEKNWVPFVHNDRLKVVYKSNPFTILAANGADFTKEHESQGFIWEYGNICGGAPPVYKDGLYYHFFHSKRPSKKLAWIYYVGCYTFDEDFRLHKITKKPILCGSDDDYMEPHSAAYKTSVVFPCGAMFRDDKWFLSYGYNNVSCKFLELSSEELEGMLND